MIRRVMAVVLCLTLTAWVFLPLASTVSAVPALPKIIITELQTTAASASQEFIELYNTTDQDIDLGDTDNHGTNVWKLQFFSSTKVAVPGFAWDPKTPGLTTVSLARSDGLANIIAAHSYFIISSAPSSVVYTPGGVDPDMTYASGHMSETGGGVQLVTVTGSGTSQSFTAYDNVGWFKATPTTPLPIGFNQTPVANGSLQRTISQTDSTYFDVSQVLMPMTGSMAISPKEAITIEAEPALTPAEEVVATPEPTEPEAVPEVVTPEQDPIDDPTNTVVEPTVIINELLPNPVAPQVDTSDEYVELYNPGSQPVSLAGYTVQTGFTFSYSFTIQDQTIPAGGYVVLTSGSTNLALSNAGGQARLLDPGGIVISTTNQYVDAPEGQAWAWLNSSWQWTTTATLAAENSLTVPTPEVKVAAITVKTPAKKVASTKAAPKTVAAKPKAVKAAKTTKETVATVPQETPEAVATLHPSALASVAALAVGYGAYEYKQDITNRLRKFRADRAARRALSQKS